MGEPADPHQPWRSFSFEHRGSNDCTLSQPGGAVNRLLPLEAWSGIAESNPVLNRLRPDIRGVAGKREGTRMVQRERSTLSFHRRVLQAGRVDSKPN